MSGRLEQIVRAAREIFAEQGMAAVSVRAVAARAGIGPSTLRHYFPTQRALHEAVIAAALDAHVEDRRIGDPATPAAERLAECLEQYLPADEGQVLQLEAWLAAQARAVGPDRSEAGARVLDVASRRARERLDAWLAVLESEGRLRHPDRERHADVLFTLLDGLSLNLLTGAITLTRARAALRDVVATTVTT